MRATSLISRPARLVLSLGAVAVVATLSAGPAAAASVQHSAGSSATVATHAAKPKPTPPGNSYPAVKPHVVPKPAHPRQQAVQPATAWSVSMNASSYYLWGTQTATLTATSNADVGPTVYWFVIWEDNTIIQRCGTGTTCSVSVSYPTPQTHGFSVEISYYDGSNSQASYPNNGGFTVCNGFCVQWHGVDFTTAVGYSTLPINGVTTVTATASEDVGPSPFYIDIFDTTTGTLVGSPCGYGTVCSATVSQSAAGAHNYVAYLADNGTAFPPTRTQSTSSPTWVTWTPGGWQLSLSGPASVTSYAQVTVTTNLDITNTPYYIELFDDDTGTLQGSCKNGTTCTINAYGHTFGHNKFVAFVSANDSAYPPANIQASSNVLDVNINELIP